MTTRTKIFCLILTVVAVIWVHGLLSDPASTDIEKGSAHQDSALTDCFRQTIEGQRTFELTQPLNPNVRYYGQIPSGDDDMHKSVWLIVNACPNEAAAWDEQCRDSGTDATTCVLKSGDLAQEAIKTFQK